MGRSSAGWRASVLVALAILAAGCANPGVNVSGSPAGSGGTANPAGPSASSEAVTLRLGYFPNVTHAAAIVGVEQGMFAKALGAGSRLEPVTFNAGPDAIQALLSDAIDATYIGPNPAINAFGQSNGEAIRIIAGATSGGAFLVVRPSINSPADLRGKKLASPQLGNTQDVALRSWLAAQGLTTTLEGGGDVAILPQPNAQTLQTFQQGQIDGAWVPEPWTTRLVQEGGGKILVDERDLWPNGDFVTTHLIVSTKFLKDHPSAVERLLQGHVEATAFLNDYPEKAQRIVNDGITKITDKALAPAVLAAAWLNLKFTNDPIASSLAKSAADAETFGLIQHVDLTGIYDLTPLNKVLIAAGQPEIKLP